VTEGKRHKEREIGNGTQDKRHSERNRGPNIEGERQRGYRRGQIDGRNRKGETEREQQRICLPAALGPDL
jgi:hypothetical protein